MTLRHKNGSIFGFGTYFIAALACLAAAACDDALDVPNSAATIPAAGTIEGPVDACRRTATSGGDDADASGVSIARSDTELAIPYLIRDQEGDDQRIRVQLCQWDGQEASQCGVAVGGTGGDGSDFIPTTPAGACVLHVFHWDVGCGRFVGTEDNGSPSKTSVDNVDQDLVARISVVGSDEAPRQTAPFSLAEAGFESLPPCE